MTSRLKVLIVDDDPALREILSLRVADAGHDAVAVGSVLEALRALQRDPPALVLCDVVLPGSSGLMLLEWIREHDASIPVVMVTAHRDLDVAVQAMKVGARDFLTKPVDGVALRALLEARTAEVRAREAAHAFDAQLQALATSLVGDTRAMQELRRTVRQLASSDAPAIITGESGTGKEVVARAVHEASTRRLRPFVAVNTAALPDGLVESEVFGHEQGAFTGASRARPGCFELAERGTLFLDEIGEMPIALQPKLLRVLEDGRVRRLGGNRDVRFDVRVLAATNRPPAQAIRDGRLREDLFYRLNVFEIRVPALRERAADIALLAHHFVRDCSRKHNLAVEGVSESALLQLGAHPWPGNVRELRNVIERAVIVAREGWLERRHLPAYLQVLSPGASPTITVPLGTTLADVERSVVIQTLERVGDNKAEAARQLGVDVKTIRARLREGSRP